MREIHCVFKYTKYGYLSCRCFCRWPCVLARYVTVIYICRYILRCARCGRYIFVVQKSITITSQLSASIVAKIYNTCRAAVTSSRYARNRPTDDSLTTQRNRICLAECLVQSRLLAALLFMPALYAAYRVVIYFRIQRIRHVSRMSHADCQLNR
jgi:hypothetical protein